MYWKSHIEMITPKLNEACFMIRITRSILSLESLKMIYYACFHSIITQGLLLGGNSSQSVNIFFVYHGTTALEGQGVLNVKESWSHSDTPKLVRLLWASDKPNAETSTWQQTTLTRDRHPCPWRHSNPQSQQVSSRRLTP